MQNGLDNGPLLTEGLPGCIILRGIFGANVIWRDPDSPDNPSPGFVLVHLATANDMVVEEGPSHEEIPFVEVFTSKT